jgi:transcription antitermination factor NusG
MARVLYWPVPRSLEIPYFRCATASVGSLRRPCATANNWLSFTSAPRFHKTVCHARSLREVTARVFPGYIFVVLNLERDRWRSINGTFGVARLVSAHQRPVPVSIGVVEALLASVDELGLMRFDCGLELRQRVRVINGPFAQVLGVLQRLEAKGRVQVLLNVMGREAAVMMNQATPHGGLIVLRFAGGRFCARSDGERLWGSVSPEVR